MQIWTISRSEICGCHVSELNQCSYPMEYSLYNGLDCTLETLLHSDCEGRPWMPASYFLLVWMGMDGLQSLGVKSTELESQAACPLSRPHQDPRTSSDSEWVAQNQMTSKCSINVSSCCYYHHLHHHSRYCEEQTGYYDFMTFYSPPKKCHWWVAMLA